MLRSLPFPQGIYFIAGTDYPFIRYYLFIILLHQPLKTGDTQQINGFQGVVKEIATRATYLDSENGDVIVIPNAVIYTGTLRVRKQ